MKLTTDPYKVEVKVAWSCMPYGLALCLGSDFIISRERVESFVVSLV